MFTRRQVILSAMGVAGAAALTPVLGRFGASADAALGSGPRGGSTRFTHRGRSVEIGQFSGRSIAAVDGRTLNSHEFFQIPGPDGTPVYGSHFRPFDADDPDPGAVVRRIVDGAEDGFYRI